MSTRSGKRIHGSIDKNAVDDVGDSKTERITRGKRRKEGCDEIASETKRKHYVRYPSEEDMALASKSAKLLRSSRKAQTNTLEDQNIVATDSKALNDDRIARHTRRARKSEAIDSTENIDPNNEHITKTEVKNRRRNKTLTDINVTQSIIKTSKKKSNKKKIRQNSLIVKDIPYTNDDKNNISNMSTDLFHSAASSPAKNYNEIIPNNEENIDGPFKTTRSHDKGIENVVPNHQIQDMPSKATRSKIQSAKKKILCLEDAEMNTKRKEIIRKRKLTTDNISLISCNNSFTNIINNEDTCSTSKVEILQTNDININNIIHQEQLTDSTNNSPSLSNSLKNSNKKKKSKMDTTNDKIENVSTFEINTVQTIKSHENAQKLDTTNKNSNYNKLSVSDTNFVITNVITDEEVFKNCVNQDDQLYDISNKYKNKNKHKKKRKSTFDEINDSNTNFNATYDKETSNEDETEQTQDVCSYLNGAGRNGSKKTKKLSYNKTNADSATYINTTFDTVIANNSVNYSKLSQDILTDISNIKNSPRNKKNSTYDKINYSEISLNTTFDDKMDKISINETKETQKLVTGTKNNNKKKRKSSIIKSIADTTDINSIINLNVTFENDDSNMTDQKTRNNTPNKEMKTSRHSKFSLDQDISSNLNTTYDKKSPKIQHNSCNNSTFDKSININTTFELVKHTKQDATFNKSQSNDTRRGSSLISSENTDNISSETSKDVSRISITSDESMADNIVNTTPVLIESSMDDSQINVSPFGANKNSVVNSNAALPSDLQKEFKNDTDILDETNTEIQSQTPKNIKVKHAENEGSTTPKDKRSLIETKGDTPKREGTYTELKTPLTPLKREGTYTELNAITTPAKKEVTNVESNIKTPIKVKEIIESKNATPLKREGTFTKDSDESESPEVLNAVKTPTRRKSLPSPGRTPFPMSKSSAKDEEKNEKSVLNVTRSIEKSKRRSSDYLPRATKVMFCSPVYTPVVSQMKGKVIKSNLKGSDKSFVFDDSVSQGARPPRKRSYTQGEAEGLSSKRKRLTEGQQQSVERLARPRTASASGKLQDPGTPSKRASTSNKSKSEVTPSKCKPEGRVLRTKLPNFAALHQKQFAKMESLDECQLRKARRARQLLTPTGPVSVLERVSPRDTQPSPTEPQPQPQPRKAETPKKSIIPPESQGKYTRFGFRLNLDVNPFSFPAKTETKPKQIRDSRIKPLKRQGTLPSLAGSTMLRKEAAKQTILREKSFTEKRDLNRKENRTVIKGVRTNRRFELQMKMRNVN